MGCSGSVEVQGCAETLKGENIVFIVMGTQSSHSINIHFCDMNTEDNLGRSESLKIIMFVGMAELNSRATAPSAGGEKKRFYLPDSKREIHLQQLLNVFVDVVRKDCWNIFSLSALLRHKLQV